MSTRYDVKTLLATALIAALVSPVPSFAETRTSVTIASPWKIASVVYAQQNATVGLAQFDTQCVANWESLR